MKTKRYLLLTILLFAAIIMNAAPRSKQAITKAAMEILNSGSMFKNRAPRHDSLVVLKANEAVTIMGYRSGGFAVIGNDDRMPAVIGYSDTKYTTGNPNFEWYLHEVSKAAARAKVNNGNAGGYYLDTLALDKSIKPLLTTKWGQGAPFNDMCPAVDSTGTKAYTGCVATATAQIMYYNNYPKKGNGSGTATVYYNNQTDVPVTVDFTQSTYDYDSMLTDYSNGYTQEQADAVSRLMFDVGVASKMSYRTNGSGTFILRTANALKNDFGYENNVKWMSRNSYTDEAWMDSVYSEINELRPVLMEGTGPEGGHAFVLDGYQSDGKIHINWGWTGRNDGYYDLSLIDFNDDQHIVTGISVPDNVLEYDTIYMETPGALPELLSDSKIRKLGGLKIVGDINSTDIKHIRLFAGRDADERRTDGILHVLDLKDANIISGGQPYLNKDWKYSYSLSGSTYNNDGDFRLCLVKDKSPFVYTTAANRLPECAFSKCYSLKKIYLPENIKAIGDGAFAGLYNLDSLYIPEGDDKQYTVISDIIYNRDTTELIAAFPYISGVVKTAFTTKKIHAHAFEGCRNINTLMLYNDLLYVGSHAFLGMSGLRELKIGSTPAFEDDSVTVFNKNCELYIPGKKYSDNTYMTRYLKAWGWPSLSEDKIKTWGMCIDFCGIGDGGIVRYRYGYAGLDSATISNYTYIDKSPDVPDSLWKYAKCRDINTSTTVPGYYLFKVNMNYPNSDIYPTCCASSIKIDKGIAELLWPDDTICVGDTLDISYKLYYENGWDKPNILIPDFPGTNWISKPKFMITEDWRRDYPTDKWMTTPGKYSIYCKDKGENKLYQIVDYTGRSTLVVLDREATHIKDIHDKSLMPSNGEIYNLAGQQISSVYKGIVIKNGKKVLQR